VIARESDLCVVIGGYNSSNTQKLKEVCERYAPTVRVENAEEITRDMLLGKERIGVTAGASAPYPLIKEVLARMSEITNKEFDFESELEESLKPVHRGQRVEGTVIEIKVTDPEGGEYISNIKLTREDIETVDMLKNIRE
jgi:4-hydroxy-3-methylbut-2-enyl diphosphate reductase